MVEGSVIKIWVSSGMVHQGFLLGITNAHLRVLVDTSTFILPWGVIRKVEVLS